VGGFPPARAGALLAKKMEKRSKNRKKVSIKNETKHL
jgi:hypothetical protein